MFFRVLPIVAFSSLFFSGALHAQPTSSMPAPISSETNVNTPTDIQVDQFVSAALKIEEIKAGLQQFLAQQPEEEVTDQLIEEVNTQFNQEATKAIAQSGLSVENYSNLVALLDQDEYFLQRVQQKVEEVTSQ